MPSQPYFATVRDLQKEVRFDGTYERVGVVSDGALMSFVWIDGFQWHGRLHQHQHDQTMYVIDGRVRMVLDGTDEYVVNAGDVLYIPSNVPHEGHLFPGESCYLLEIFAPIRTDYLHTASAQLGSI